MFPRRGGAVHGATFTHAHPQVVLDLTRDDTVLDIVTEGYDAAIRIGEVITRDMVACPLGGDIRQIAAAAPAYLAECGAPQTPQDLLAHRCIRWRWPGQAAPDAWEFCEDGRWFSIAVDGRRLVALLEPWSAPFAGFFLCYPRQRQMAPALRVPINELRACSFCQASFVRHTGC